LETTSAGIRCRITSAIRIRVTIAGTTIVDTTMPDTATGETVDMTMTTGGGAA
jgi:hypothetical protein